MNLGVGARLARSKVAHIAFAFLAMGGWAFFANRAHGLQAAALAGLVQGAVSAVITLLLQRALETMFARLRGRAALVTPPSVSCVIVLAALLSIHGAAGTQEVISTIALPYAVSSLYAWSYTASLQKRRDLGQRRPT